MLTSIRLVDVLSFVDATIPLAPLTVLVGPNNAGKTNALRALYWLGRVVRQERAQEIQHIPMTRAGAHGTWSMHVTASESDLAPLVVKGDASPPSVIGPRESYGRLLNAPGVFAFELAHLRKPFNPSATFVLGEQGEGLPRRLFDLRDEKPKAFEAVERDLRSLAPEVERIAFPRWREGQECSLAFQEKGVARPTIASAASDGLLLLTAVLYVRHALDGALLLLEEIERGVHPWRLKHIVDTLNDAVFAGDGEEPRQQIVVTTHSPYFLDRFRDDPDAIVVIERDEQRGSMARRLSEIEGIEGLREKSLGELFYTGVLGGVPR